LDNARRFGRSLIPKRVTRNVHINKMTFTKSTIPLLFLFLPFLCGCATSNKHTYISKNEPHAEIKGDSALLGLFTGSKTTRIIQVDGKSTVPFLFPKAIRVPPGSHKIRICAEDGFRLYYFDFKMNIEKGKVYQAMAKWEYEHLHEIKVKEARSKKIVFKEILSPIPIADLHL